MNKIIVGIHAWDVYGDGQEFAHYFAIYLKIQDEIHSLWNSSNDLGNLSMDDKMILNELLEKIAFYQQELNMPIEVTKEAISLEDEYFETNVLEKLTK